MFHPMKAYELHNGATAADWLGTAETAARVAADLLDGVRRDVSGKVVYDLDAAELYLAQALDEIATVRERLGIAHAVPRIVPR